MCSGAVAQWRRRKESDDVFAVGSRVAVDLLAELDEMFLCVGVDLALAAPHVAVVVVMLITVLAVLVGPVFPAPRDAEVDQSSPLRLHHPVVVLVAGGWVDGAVATLLVFRLLSHVDVLHDTALDVVHTLHDVAVAPVHRSVLLLLPSSHPRHVHHALAAGDGLHGRGLHLGQYSWHNFSRTTSYKRLLLLCLDLAHNFLGSLYCHYHTGSGSELRLAGASATLTIDLEDVPDSLDGLLPDGVVLSHRRSLIPLVFAFSLLPGLHLFEPELRHRFLPLPLFRGCAVFGGVGSGGAVGAEAGSLVAGALREQPKTSGVVSVQDHPPFLLQPLIPQLQVEAFCHTPIPLFPCPNPPPPFSTNPTHSCRFKAFPSHSFPCQTTHISTQLFPLICFALPCTCNGFVWESLEWKYTYFLYSMGQACSTCQNKNLSFEEIQVDSEDPVPKADAAVPQNSPITPKECEEAKKDEKKKEISVLTSKFNQTRAYQKFGASGVKLETMPDYSNEQVREKKSQYGPFLYDREQLEVENAHSLGPIEFEKKYVYEGQWKGNERNGRGVQQWRDGSVYEGYWRNNVAHGYGRLIHADGDVYLGEWLDDRASGKGIYHSFCGAKYEGQWREDKQHGYGEEVWPDEAVYKGEYRNGKKHGKGVFLWEDDSCYEGEFSENNIHGFGKYVWKDGRVYEGEWMNNKMEGRGVFTWLDGRRYQGEYKNDKKEGFGVFTFRDGRVYEGEWRNGKQHGKGVFRKKNISREGLWQDGERVSWVDESKENDTPGPSKFKTDRENTNQ